MIEVTEKDLVGELTGFPIEVVQMMILMQVEQGNVPSVQKFQYEPRAARDSYGFDWDATYDGFEFWARVIGKRQWDVFFDRYPHAIVMPSIKKAKPLKASRKIHFTKAQKWCLERMRVNSGTLSDRARAVYNTNLCNTHLFDFPILPRDVDDALKVFCIPDYDSGIIDNKRSVLYTRISETLASLFYMHQALNGESISGTIRIWDEKLKGVRSVISWAKKHYDLLGNVSRVRFSDRTGHTKHFEIVGEGYAIPTGYTYDKSLGAYSCSECATKFIIGKFLVTIN